MKSGSLPTFICVGGMKCGTSSLHRYLGEHPNVCVSSDKETDFFLRENEKCEDWYRSFFTGEAKEYGESCTNYTKCHVPRFSGVPKRMYNLLPDINIIYVIRDPIERAISHYTHKYLENQISCSIREALIPPKKSHILKTSLYYFQIKKYLKYYNRNQITFVQTEKLKKDRINTVNEIFRFIGVKPLKESKLFEEEYHTSDSKVPMSNIKHFLIKYKIGRNLKKIGKRIFSKNTKKRVKKMLRRGFKKTSLSNRT